MSFLTTIFSPFNLLFLIILTGLAIGKIRIHQISLGVAGILFVAIFSGVLMNKLIPNTYIDIISNAQSTMKIFSNLGTSLFISVIGLQTGFSIKNNYKGSLISFTIGILMSVSGVMVMLLISALDQTISYPALLGILCGALTSTPGLSSVCELIGSNSEEAVLGYGCSYLIGVLLVVLFVQIFTQRSPKQNSVQNPKVIGTSKIYAELITVCITALLGNVLGNIYIYPLNISLGSTVCTLTVGLIVGYITHKKLVRTEMSSQVLNSFKTLGISFFFVGTGYSAGVQSVTFDIRTIIYGALITLAAILSGLLLSRIVFSRYQLNTGFVISGGMTSSPAYGSISSQASEMSTNHFAFAYFGALISLIAIIQVIGR